MYNAAQDFGYRASLSGLRRLLIARGFVSEVERYRRFFLQEMNREAIQLFLMKHRLLSMGKILDEHERTLLFSRTASGGTEAGVLLVLVMKSLSTLLEELQQLSSLEARVLAHTALSETKYFFAIDRVRWYREQVIRLQSRMAEKVVLEEMLGKFAIAVKDESQERDAFLQGVHDGEVVMFLKSIHEAVRHLNAIFTRKEEELHQ